jgi:hypothetical protein
MYVNYFLETMIFVRIILVLSTQLNVCNSYKYKALRVSILNLKIHNHYRFLFLYWYYSFLSGFIGPNYFNKKYKYLHKR